jgi:two-component system phosphate regulon sensor histidine kinase PhoR
MRNITAEVQTDQIRKDFVANASHELRTPLSIIAGYLENLTEEGGLDNKEVAQNMLSTMDRHVVRINRIVEDMLVISKLESNEGTPLKMESFNLAVCIRDVVERLDLLIVKQKAAVRINAPEVTLTGDRFYWTQILFNLIENALKQNATTPVEVEVEVKKKKNGPIIISVSDNGIGIPSSDLPFIFKRFFRVEKHHSQNQIKGTGLGLSIVKRAVEAHGGIIEATSTPSTRTTFTMTVPSKPTN